MAKRIKVKGNPPRGLSKYERQYNYAYRSRGGLGGGRRVGNREMMSTVKRVNRDGTVEPHWSPIADKNVMSRPSSTRKKRVKEGNRKFIGPRQLRSELAEDREAKVLASEGAPVKYIDRGPGRAGHIYEVDEGGILPFETSRREMRQLSRLQKETNPASKRRVNEILRRILDQYLGGG